ncbi:hypothetical protein KQ916_29310, partial [Klebsiella pneumoniae]|nr:hypothetical protein [Klebsiella pneumoniae]
FIVGGPVGDFELLLCHGTVCVVGKIRDLILQLSKSSIYSTKPIFAARNTYFKRKVFICCLYSEESKESNLNNKNRLYEIRMALLQIVGGDKLIIPFC